MSDMFKNWFEVDRKGLTKLIERRGKIALVLELIANGLDADGTTRVEVLLEPEQGVPHATVLVTDDSPEGFADISNQLTREQWDNVKKHDAERTRPAGQIAPTHKVKFSPDGEDRWVPREKWTPAMRAVVAYSADVCRELVGVPVEVSILLDITERAAACYGSQDLVFNLGRLGHQFFDECVASEQVCRENLDRITISVMRPTVRLNELLIHEVGHHIESNHLDERYHDALCALGAKLTRLALAKPELFRREVD